MRFGCLPVAQVVAEMAEQGGEPARDGVELAALGQGVPALEEPVDVLTPAVHFGEQLRRRCVEVVHAELLDHLFEVLQRGGPEVGGLGAAGELDRFKVTRAHQGADGLEGLAAVRRLLLFTGAERQVLSGSSQEPLVLVIGCRPEGLVERTLEQHAAEDAARAPRCARSLELLAGAPRTLPE